MKFEHFRQNFNFNRFGQVAFGASFFFKHKNSKKIYKKTGYIFELSIYWCTEIFPKELTFNF